MGTLFAYSLAMTIPFLLMAIVYKLLLARTTQHKFNRRILLLIYAVTLTCVPATLLVNNLIGRSNLTSETGDVSIIAIDGIIKTQQQNIATSQVFLFIYILVVAILLMKFIVSIVRILILVTRNERIKKEDYSIVLHEKKQIVPFSWGKWIFMYKQDYTDCSKYIIAHEREHLKAFHWIDLLLAECVIIINWFNPASWIMRNALQDVHEFQADENVLKSSNSNQEEYQLFLIKKTVGTRFAAIANSLNHSSLKKRITMMLQKKSQSKVHIRALALAPVVALGMLFVSNPLIATTLSSVSSATITIDTPSSDKVSENPLKAPDKMPEFPGGMQKLMTFIGENVKYPQEAIKNKTEGNVFVRFIISKTGKVTNPQIIRGVSKELDEEALRVVSMLPDFIPGEDNGKKVPVEFTIPIKFKLNK